MNNTTSQYDFSRVGKAMPYRVSQDRMEHSKALLRDRLHMLERRALLRRSYIAVAAVILLAVVYPLVRIVMDKASDSSQIAPIYSVTSPADNWSDFAEADIFLDSMDW